MTSSDPEVAPYAGSDCVVSIVLGTYNRLPLFRKAIEAVRNNGIGVPFEIIVVDGGSTDGTGAWVIEQKDILTIVQHNRGDVRGTPLRRKSWGYFMNLGFRSSKGKYVLMISDDCLLHPGSVQAGVDRFEAELREGRKVAGLAFYFRNWPAESDYYVQRTLGGKLFVNHGMYLRSAMEEVGWADEERYIFYKADGDFCLKMWEQGYEILECPESFVEHYVDPSEEVRSSNQGRILDHDRKAYIDRWKGIYYFPDRTDPRGKVTLAYRDPHNTVEQLRPFLNPQSKKPHSHG